MVNQAEVSLHQWLNLTLAAGGVLVVFGIVVSMIGGAAARLGLVKSAPISCTSTCTHTTICSS